MSAMNVQQLCAHMLRTTCVSICVCTNKHTNVAVDEILAHTRSHCVRSIKLSAPMSWLTTIGERIIQLHTNALTHIHIRRTLIGWVCIGINEELYLKCRSHMMKQIENVYSIR
jgi:hypothetical protein